MILFGKSNSFELWFPLLWSWPCLPPTPVVVRWFVAFLWKVVWSPWILLAMYVSGYRWTRVEVSLGLFSFRRSNVTSCRYPSFSSVWRQPEPCLETYHLDPRISCSNYHRRYYIFHILIPVLFSVDKPPKRKVSLS